MKKLLATLLMLTLVATMFIGCGGQEAVKPEEEKTPGEESNETPLEANDDNTAEIVLVTNGPTSTIDDRGFNQLAWIGVQNYAKEHDLTTNYYLPVEFSTASYIQSIDVAVKNGAKIIICPGFLMANAVYEAQTTYPDVKFILIDSTPSNEDGDVLIADNTVCMTFAEDQSGFMAGYAAVHEGYTNLGFFGALAVPAVIRFGYGYVQGAEYAAQELGLEPDSIEMRYTYTGSFDNTPEFQTKAASWYQTGTQCIFGCGSPDNVFAACESVGGDIVSVGVDTDMAENSETCLTSAMKKLDPAIYDALEKAYSGNFPGGTATLYDIEFDAVGLPMETSRFKKFTNEQYEALVADMKADKDGICSNMIIDVDKDGNAVSLEELGETLTYVKLVIVE